MKEPKPKGWPERAPKRAWAAAALASLLSSAALHGGMLSLFHDASQSRWLMASPRLAAALASCRALPGRGSQLSCERKALAAASSPASAPVLAAAGPAALK